MKNDPCLTFQFRSWFAIVVWAILSLSPLPFLLGEDLICHWAHGAIEIDGKEEDEAWNHAATIDRFRIPGTQAQPKTATRAKLLWDREYFYFYAELTDHDLFGDVIEHDAQTWNNDVFELFLKPSREHPGYYEFQVNAAGTEMDMYLPDQKSGGYNALKSRDTFHWKTAVQRFGTLDRRDDRDRGWTVEGRIPWIDFSMTGGRPDLEETWQLALCRYDYTLGQKPELSSCAPLTESNFHRYQDYANLRFAGPGESNPSLKSFLNRQTSVDSKVMGSPEPALPFRAVRAFPNLKLEWPVDVQREPGTRRLIIIEEKGSYGPTKIRRTAEDLDRGELESLVDPEGVAYSIAFHPKFVENGFMYIGSNGKKDGESNKSRVVQYKLARTPSDPVVGEPKTIIEWESNGHNGAAITFGKDGMMYVTSGDGTSDSDTNDVGQDLSKLLAKVLRIDVDHPTEDATYSVPADNPFVGRADARPETWAYGLRNPWRMTTDPKTGHIWVGNNGQDMFEQAYLIERGANYGWSVFEGGNPFYVKRKLGPTPHVKPTVEHPHSESRSLTGGVVYHGSQLPSLRGAYLYGDYSTGKIWGVHHDGQKILWHKEIADTTLQISAISLDADGELLVVDHRGDQQGGLYRLEPTPTLDNPPVFPRKLSETGLFESVQGHRVEQGLIPYSVNAPLWSDGASKFRFIALPKDGRIELADPWAWQFPENTVLVKSFALEMVAGDPSSQRWIETRLMTKQQGEWVGYSYAWNDEQTEAHLVEAAGRDRTFTLRAENGPRSQTWHYPSRTECMVCHTRAAGFVLGLSTLQMNKEHLYDGNLRLNQLEALELLGVLKFNWQTQAKEGLRAQMQREEKSKEEIDGDLAKLQTGTGQREARSHRLLGKRGEAFPKLVDPYDPSASLEKRARAYLHSNCAYCHIPAGGGNAQMDLSHPVALDRMNMVDVKPVHHTFDKSDAKLVAPGSIDRSVLIHRVGLRGPGQMPQLGTSIVDQPALEMLKAWVASMAETATTAK